MAAANVRWGCAPCEPIGFNPFRRAKTLAKQEILGFGGRIRFIYQSPAVLSGGSQGLVMSFVVCRFWWCVFLSCVFAQIEAVTFNTSWSRNATSSKTLNGSGGTGALRPTGISSLGTESTTLQNVTSMGSSWRNSTASQNGTFTSPAPGATSMSIGTSIQISSSVGASKTFSIQ
jgi:hypothetical protein